MPWAHLLISNFMPVVVRDVCEGSCAAKVLDTSVLVWGGIPAIEEAGGE
jgi:hypothetical protein